MIEFLKVLLYGFIEGVTEWLPISSTGHLILLKEILPLNRSAEFMSMFLVVIQLGAILAVVLIYFKRLWPFKRDINRQLEVNMTTINLWIKILVACIPAAVIGILFDDIIDKYLYNPYVVALMLIAFGIGFIWVEERQAHKEPSITMLSQITYRSALIIGGWQVLAAILPGTSRSGATILGAILLGMSRPLATHFTFFLAIPVMFGASLLKIVKFGFAFSIAEIFTLLCGMIVSFLVSIVVIKLLLNYIKKHDFKLFGYYRIGLGVLVLLYFMISGFLK